MRNNKEDQKMRMLEHKEACLTLLRFAVKFSEVAKKYQGRSLKIQPQTSFDLNGLKNGPSKHFERSLKSMHLFQRFMRGMNHKYW